MNTCRMELFPGVWLTAVQTPKFKSSFWSAQFLTPLREEQASLNALVPKVLRQGTQRFPNLAAWSRALDERYGGAVEPVIRKRGEAQCVGFAASFLSDRLAPEPIDLVEEGAELLGELFFHPLTEGNAFSSATVEGEKKNLIDQLTGEINDKVHYANQRAIQLMCEGEGYGLNRLGTVETAQAARPETVYEAYEGLLSSAPMELYYCGWAEPEQVAEALRRAFAPLPLSKERDKVTQTAPAA